MIICGRLFHIELQSTAKACQLLSIVRLIMSTVEQYLDHLLKYMRAFKPWLSPELYQWVCLLLLLEHTNHIRCMFMLVFDIITNDQVHRG